MVNTQYQYQYLQEAKGNTQYQYCQEAKVNTQYQYTMGYLRGCKVGRFYNTQPVFLLYVLYLLEI